MKQKLYFQVTHPAYGSDRLFDDWATLCRVTMDLAEEATKKRLDDIFNELMCKLSDEMIETAYEIPETEALKAYFEGYE